MINLPTWEESKNKVDTGDDSPLEFFIYHNEPAGREDDKFREQLLELLEWITEDC